MEIHDSCDKMNGSYRIENKNNAERSGLDTVSGRLDAIDDLGRMVSACMRKDEHESVLVEVINCGYRYTTEGKLTKVANDKELPYITIGHSTMPLVGFDSAVRSISFCSSGAIVYANNEIPDDYGAPWLRSNRAFEKYYQRSFGKEVTVESITELLNIETYEEMLRKGMNELE